VYTGTSYLRSIEFATPTLGFCGTLSNRFLRTNDGGNTWENIITSITPVPAGICGLAAPTAERIYGVGVWSHPANMVRSTDGGDSWSVVHTTGTGSDYIWKPQTPDGIHLYGSIDGPPGSGTRYVRSSDAGLTWQTDTFTMDYTYVQVIGFLDSQHGWTGGFNQLFETTDGGETWQIVFFGN